MKAYSSYTIDLDEPATCAGCSGEVAAGERAYVLVETWDSVPYRHVYHDWCQFGPRAEASAQAVPA